MEKNIFQQEKSRDPIAQFELKRRVLREDAIFLATHEPFNSYYFLILYLIILIILKVNHDRKFAPKSLNTIIIEKYFIYLNLTKPE